jgi:hypothetical protein
MFLYYISENDWLIENVEKVDLDPPILIRDFEILFCRFVWFWAVTKAALPTFVKNVRNIN